MATATTSTFLEELRWRGFLDAVTSDDLDTYLSEARRTLYVGFDPTADSLHLGSLIPVMALAHCQRHGHRPLVLVGGGTGLIGDPSGKSSERTLLTLEQTEANAAAIRAQLSKFFDLSSDERALMLNNAQWLVPLNLLGFLRDVGKHFSVNEMIKRDSVRARLEERDQGISFTEFAYMLLQAYDFYHLYLHHDCTVQMGGSDQWGNILSGKELIRRVLGQRGEGITFPLLTTASGKKFGKTEEGAVWLDPNRTSPYQMYQYWLQTADADVARYLKLFTFLDREPIDDLAREVELRPEKRQAQRVLAAECTGIIHGKELVAAIEAASRILFSASDEIPDTGTIAMLAREVPVTNISPAELNSGIELVDLLVRTRLAESKGAARKAIEGGGVYLNNERQAQARKTVSTADVKWPGALLLRTGKKNYHLVVIEEHDGT
ncbi:MAG TPA: tyrosine--tRNA ligase [Bryobacteraceae bacterium]|jgi:tyrosyl-tRNA synthetase|nr:tyrosine--tRNA ligase [Bryobacteraceae bacterium]